MPHCCAFPHFLLSTFQPLEKYFSVFCSLFSAKLENCNFPRFENRRNGAKKTCLIFGASCEKGKRFIVSPFFWQHFQLHNFVVCLMTCFVSLIVLKDFFYFVWWKKFSEIEENRFLPLKIHRPSLICTKSGIFCKVSKEFFARNEKSAPAVVRYENISGSQIFYVSIHLLKGNLI